MSFETRHWLTPFLTSSLLALASCRNDTTAPPASLIGRFDLFWQTFDTQYSYFTFKHISWDSLRNIYRPSAEAATTQEELVALLTQMVVPLRDVHVTFRTPLGVSQPTFQPSATVNWTYDLWQRNIAFCAYKQAKPNLGSCMLNGFAYVVVGSWDPASFSISDLDAVIDQFRDAPGMIIDVRTNGGGYDALAFALAGRFAAHRTHTGYVRYRNGRSHDDFGDELPRYIDPRGSFQFTRPVVVLSGRAVFSSAESFISAMRELPNVTVVGDTTGGGSGNPGTYPLGDGWTYTVSRWMEWTADRRVIEWNGIPPDIFVAWDSGSVNQGRDAVYRAALQLLRASSATGARAVTRQP